MPRKLTKAQALGRAIAVVRTSHGMNQRELARACGFDPSYVSLLERGLRQVSLSYLERLGKLLAVTPSRLLEMQQQFMERTWRP